MGDRIWCNTGLGFFLCTDVFIVNIFIYSFRPLPPARAVLFSLLMSPYKSVLSAVMYSYKTQALILPSGTFWQCSLSECLWCSSLWVGCPAIAVHSSM